MEIQEAIPQTPAAASEKSYWLVRDDKGPAIETDPAEIIVGLRRELNRLSMIHDSSCIFILSLDTDGAAKAMDELCGRIAACLRSYDALYRFTPDKFLVMLPHIGREDAVGVIRRLRARVLSAPFNMNDGDPVRLTASFGGAMLDSSAPLHEHMDRASEAHSWALKGRGDSICMWTPQL